MTFSIDAFEASVGALVLSVRAEKVIVNTQLSAVLSLLQIAADEFNTAPFLPRRFAALAHFAFSGLLAEAGHARDERQRQEIVDAAWQIDEAIVRVVGLGDM
ncbi:MAG: hypothetical protein JNL19_05700 [Burkholderiales bacterium]|nr:hypothetical protein [Burkholderiales bacterium]